MADPREISGTGEESGCATATASNNTPGDITIDSGGSVTLDSGTAVTINSSNAVTNNGTITTGGAGSTALLIDGTTPINMTLTNAGTITQTDTTGPGDYGVHLTGGPVQGTINFTSAGSVSVAGANSFGVAIDSPFTGAITLNNVVVTGTGSTAISLTGPVTGDVTLTGASSAGIGNGTGFISTAPITGALANNGTVEAGIEQVTTNGSVTVPRRDRPRCHVDRRQCDRRLRQHRHGQRACRDHRAAGPADDDGAAEYRAVSCRLRGQQLRYRQ